MEVEVGVAPHGHGKKNVAVVVPLGNGKVAATWEGQLQASDGEGVVAPRLEGGVVEVGGLQFQKGSRHQQSQEEGVHVLRRHCDYLSQVEEGVLRHIQAGLVRG